MSAELNSVDYFVLTALLDDVESVESILGSPNERSIARFTQEEIEQSLQRLIIDRLVDRVEFDQESKAWKKFADYKKDQWFDLTEEGRSIALHNSAK